jgi:PhnB protein
LKLNPYLFFDGNCEEAFRFYAKILGGEIIAMLPHRGTPAEAHVPPEWQDKIMHASMTVPGGVLMASDAPPGQHNKPQGFSVALHLNDPAEAERIFHALAEGGQVQMPFGETFWALRFGMLVDRFGMPWMVNVHRPAEAGHPASGHAVSP